MISFMSLMRPAGQIPAGQNAADTSSAPDSQTLNIFAGLIQKFLFNTTDAPPVTPDAVVPAGTFAGFGVKGKTVEKIDGAGSAEEIEPRPLKLKSKDGAESAPVVVMVPQSELKQVASLMPEASAVWGVSASLSASVAAGGSGDAMSPADDTPAGPGSAESAQSAVAGITGAPTETWGQVNFAQPFVSLHVDGDMLLSLLREVPPSGGKTAAGAGSPSEPVKTLPAGEVPVPAGPAKAQTIKNSVPDIAQAIKNSVPEIAQAIKNSVPDVGQPITQDVKTGALDLAAFSDAPGNTMPSPAPSHILPVAPDTGVAPAVAALLTPEIAPAVLPRVSIPRVGVEGVSPRSASKEPRLLETVSPVEESPAPGILTGTVRNVIGIVPRTGDKQNSQDTADDGTLPAPALGETASPGSPAPALADVQAQPSRKPSAETPGESPSTAPVDAAGTVRAPSDLSAFRTSQAALGSQMTPGKQDPVTSAAPLREIPSPYAPLPAEVSHRIADQVVQNLKLQVDGSTSEIKMTLKPPSLGEVQLSIHVEDSKMAAQIDVSQAVVKAALEAHMPQLRLALQEHGIEVQRIDVMLPEQSLQREGSGTGGERTGRRGTRRSLSGDDPESLQGAKDMGYNTIELIM